MNLNRKRILMATKYKAIQTDGTMLQLINGRYSLKAGDIVSLGADEDTHASVLRAVRNQALEQIEDVVETAAATKGAAATKASSSKSKAAAAEVVTTAVEDANA